MSITFAQHFKQHMLKNNAVLNRISPVFVIVFVALTFADRLHLFKCGWFWTSVGALFCLTGYFVGKKHQSLGRSLAGAILVIVGFSSGITPFLAPYILPLLNP